jgi:hypothetical protein
MEVGGIERPPGSIVSCDHRLASVVGNFQQLAFGPAAHDHVVLGQRIVPALGEDRTIILFDKALEGRDVFEALADCCRVNPFLEKCRDARATLVVHDIGCER